MKNSDILKTHPDLLVNLDRQRQYCLKLDLVPMECPACHHRASMIEASGLELDEFPVDTHAGVVFTCPGCKRELQQVVPFYGPNMWRLKQPISA